MYVSWKTSFVYISGHNHYLWGCGGRQRECSICSPSAGGAVGHGQRDTHRCAAGGAADFRGGHQCGHRCDALRSRDLGDHRVREPLLSPRGPGPIRVGGGAEPHSHPHPQGPGLWLTWEGGHIGLQGDKVAGRRPNGRKSWPSPRGGLDSWSREHVVLRS